MLECSSCINWLVASPGEEHSTTANTHQQHVSFWLLEAEQWNWVQFCLQYVHTRTRAASCLWPLTSHSDVWPLWTDEIKDLVMVVCVSVREEYMYRNKDVVRRRWRIPRDGRTWNTNEGERYKKCDRNGGENSWDKREPVMKKIKRERWRKREDCPGEELRQRDLGQAVCVRGARELDEEEDEQGGTEESKKRKKRRINASVG